MRRNSSYNEDVARSLREGGRYGVREFFLGLTEGDDDLELEQALRITITRIGIKEFCEMSKIQMPNVSAFLKGRRKLKPETIDTYLKPFGLRVRLVVAKAS